MPNDPRIIEGLNPKATDDEFCLADEYTDDEFVDSLSKEIAAHRVAASRAAWKDAASYIRHKDTEDQLFTLPEVADMLWERLVDHDAAVADLRVREMKEGKS